MQHTGVGIGQENEKRVSFFLDMTRKHIIAVTLVSIALFIAYANSLNGTWAMDDIVANRPVSIKDIDDFVGFRKMTYMTFLLNQFIAPFSPANFRLLNIFIHILNSALVYLIAYKTILLYTLSGRQNTPLEPPSPKGGKLKRIIPGKKKSTVRQPLMDEEEREDKNTAFYAAMFSSVLFALHPLNINAVAYIVQRMASLSTFFVLVALLCYMYASQIKNNKKSVMLYIMCGVSIVAGIFSKENAVMAVPLILLYDYVFLSHFRWNLFRKRLMFVVSLGIFSIGLAFYLLKMQAALVDVIMFFFNPHQPLTEKEWMARDVYWTPLQHVLTEFRVVCRYLAIILFPLPKSLVFDWWSFPVSQSLMQPMSTLFSAILIVALLFFALWKIKRFPLICFGILWYFTAISLESFIAVGSDLYFEHRNYLPVSGLFVGAAGQISVSVKPKLNKNILMASILICGIVLGVLTFSRNFIWKDSLTLWGDTLVKVPSNIRAMMALGHAYLRSSDFDNAGRYYKEVVLISSKDRRAEFLDDSLYSLGMVYLFSGRLKEAKNLIDAFGNTVESYRPQILSGFYKAMNNDTEGALRDYNGILDQTKGIDAVVVRTLMGDSYRKEGLWDKALQRYREALSLDPGFSAAYYGIGVVFMNKRDIVPAHEYFEKALLIDPDNVLALSDMADLMLIRKGHIQDALHYAQRAVSKKSSLHEPYLTMGNVLIVLRRETEAEEFYKEAIERGVEEYMVAFSRARAYYLGGDSEKAKKQIAELKKFKNLPDKIKNLIAQE